MKLHYSIILLVSLLYSSYAITKGNNDEKGCSKFCNNHLATSVVNKKSCIESYNVPPRPMVFKACSGGLLLGQRAACMAACSGNNQINNSLSACQKKYQQQGTGLLITWCRNGYDAGFKATHSELRGILNDLGRDNDSDKKSQNEPNNIVSAQQYEAQTAAKEETHILTIPEEKPKSPQSHRTLIDEEDSIFNIVEEPRGKGEQFFEEDHHVAVKSKNKEPHHPHSPKISSLIPTMHPKPSSVDANTNTKDDKGGNADLAVGHSKPDYNGEEMKTVIERRASDFKTNVDTLKEDVWSQTAPSERHLSSETSTLSSENDNNRTKRIAELNPGGVHVVESKHDSLKEQNMLLQENDLPQSVIMEL